MTAAPGTFRLRADERERYESDGFVVRERAFSGTEVDAIVAACERLIDDLVRDRQGSRLQMGSYVFEPDLKLGVTIKWEGDSDVVHGIEPFAHMAPELERWAYDARFIEPMQDICGDAHPILFTEKLNLKRPHHGGVNPLHQDYPYWKPVADDVDRVATAMLFLDDSTRQNGCLQVLPGSHRRGVQATRNDKDDFGNYEMDPGPFVDVALTSLEVPAGTVVLFGPLLVHRSDPNRSALDRRALLYSYQPEGSRHLLDFLRRLAKGRVS
jgi:ectoine hydroxylase-related dioxygenase (phytanoyl-CoA dioxygenase family)